jgi:hypothetical protein
MPDGDPANHGMLRAIQCGRGMLQLCLFANYEQSYEVDAIRIHRDTALPMAQHSQWPQWWNEWSPVMIDGQTTRNQGEIFCSALQRLLVGAPNAEDPWAQFRTVGPRFNFPGGKYVYINLRQDRGYHIRTPQGFVGYYTVSDPS